jgi:putative transposase
LSEGPAPSGGHWRDRRPKQIIAEVAEETGSILLETEVMPNHVHYLIEVDRQFEFR